MRRTTPLLFCAALTLIAAHAAHADGECAKGYRDTTDAERQTMTNVLEAVQAALPAAPDGWVITSDADPTIVTQSICKDAEATPWSYDFTRLYRRTDDLEQRDQLAADAAAQRRAAQDARQPRIDALMAKMQDDLAPQLIAAAQKGDQARADSLNAEVAKLQAEVQQIYAEIAAEADIESKTAAIYGDREIAVTVTINSAYISDVEMQSAAAPAGARTAFRKETTDGGLTLARVIVLLGGWQPRADGGMQTARRGTAPSAGAHSVAVDLTADPARIDGVLATIDFGALAALSR